MSDYYGAEPVEDWSWKALGMGRPCQGKGDAYPESRETGCAAKKSKEKEPAAQLLKYTVIKAHLFVRKRQNSN